MKCMSVPANLSWEEWRNLAERQFVQIGYKGRNEEHLRMMFDEGLTVNEAVSLSEDEES